MSDNRYRTVCQRFLLFTTPVYSTFFLVLIAIRYLNYDQFTNTVLLVSVAHLGLLQLIYTGITKYKSHLTKDDLFQVLWAMVLSNIILFSYWVYWLEQTRVLMYILAPMSCVALFSVASFKQSVGFNVVQTCAMCFALVFSTLNSDDPLAMQALPLHLIYLFVLLIMCLWLSSIAATHANLKSERDRVVKSLRGMANAALESDTVDKSAKQLAQSSMQSAAIATNQQKAAEQLATTVEELLANAGQNAEQARHTLVELKKTEQKVSKSYEDITQLVSSIDSVRQSGEQIKNINAVIDDIAYQTNLLSLNAMIEASRSGDEGSGFKVVALEVRKLAERSAEAAKGINNLLENNRQSIEHGVDLSAQTLQSFERIQEDILPLARAMQSVTDASHEQSHSIEHLSGISHDIESASQHILQLADTTRTTAEELEYSSTSLNEMIAQLERRQ